MKWLAVLLKFLNALIVGDSWPLTAAVVIVLGAGAGVLRLDASEPVTLVLVIAASLLLGAPAVVLIEAARHCGRDGR